MLSVEVIAVILYPFLWRVNKYFSFFLKLLLQGEACLVLYHSLVVHFKKNKLFSYII